MDALGNGRYRLGTVVVRRASGGLVRAVDTRLGRDVLVQYDDGTWFAADAAARLFATERDGIARLLDGGEDVVAGGGPRAFAVYPDSDWLPLGQVSHRVRRQVRATVAWDTDDLLVDPGPADDGAGADPPAVLWVPSPVGLEAFSRPRPVTTHRPKHALAPGSRSRWATVGTLPAPFREEVA